MGGEPQPVEEEPFKTDMPIGGDGYRLGVDQEWSRTNCCKWLHNEQHVCGGNQVGGGSPFNHYKPKNRRNISIFSRQGKALLKSYVKQVKVAARLF